jgi:lipid A 3-O-deacylase
VIAARLAFGLVCLAAAAPAAAGEIFGGVYVHDVDTRLTKSGIEGGADLQLGWRGGRIAATPLQPYAYLSAHTKGQTHFAAAGLSARFGDQIFFRPGVGLAVHTGSAKKFQDPTNDQIDFGSRILFAPEMGIGARLGPRTSIEASWVHLSHAQLFGGQNPGMDSIGMRLTIDLP